MAINAIGSGPCGVGLMVTFIYDRESGKRYLATEKMVLDGISIVFINEFNLMSDDDKVKIYKLMEHWTFMIL